MKRIRCFTQIQDLPVSLEEAWAFFSSPANLDAITPPDLGFRILSDLPGRMFEGQIIEYRVKIAPMLWLPWVTEIKAVKEGQSFIDEQRFGPYGFWHHRHSFDPLPGGVRMTDVVHYALPMWPLGEWADPWFVRPKLTRIFGYRREVLARKFGCLSGKA